MRLTYRLILLLIIIVFGQTDLLSQASARGAAVSTRQEEKGNTYAVIVGISDYVGVPKLNYADDDALLFADFLTRQNICQRKNVHLLINEKATTSGVYKALKMVTDSLKSGDVFYFYFAGHGDVESSLESGFLLTYNSEGSNYAATSIELNMLERYMNAMVDKRARVVIVTDACRSGNLAGGLDGRSATLSALSGGFKQVVKFLSCLPDQLSLEKKFKEGGHGIFTYLLIKGLSGEADLNKDKVITGIELNRFLMNKMAEETNDGQVPKFEGNLSAPVVVCDTSKVYTIPQLEWHLSKIDSVSSVIPDENPWKANIYYQLFFQQLIDQHYYPEEPAGAEAGAYAFNTIAAARKAGQPKQMISQMTLELATILEERAQGWINRYLRREFNSRKADSMVAALVCSKNDLETVESLLGAGDMRYQEIHAKKLFFQSYLIYNKKDSNRYDIAISDLEKASKILSTQSWIYNILAIFYKDRKRYAEAEASYKKAISLSPAWCYPYNNYGLLLASLNRNDEAQKMYETSIRCDSTYSNPITSLGRFLMEKGKFGEAEEVLIKGARAEIYPSPWIALGDLYMKQEKFADAFRCYLKAFTINPAASNYSRKLLDVSRSYDCSTNVAFISLLEQTLKDKTNDDKVLTNLGALFLQIGDLSKAEYALVKASILDPKNLEASCFLAAVFSRTGRMDLGIIQLENACKNGFRDFPLLEKDPFFHELLNSDKYKGLKKNYGK